MTESKKKTTYRIQGTVSQEEREYYSKMKENWEKETLNGVKVGDGVFLMYILKEYEKNKK